MEHLRDQIEKIGSPWKSGNELLPYHPSASHVSPDQRDGWNWCYVTMLPRMKRLEAEVTQARLAPAPLADSEAQQLQAVRRAMDDYHAALTRREHGGVASSRALVAIEQALGMCWKGCASRGAP